MAEVINYRQYGPFYSGVARLVSFALAIGLSSALLIMPQLVAIRTHELDHGSLSLAMLGISAGFVHGVGYVPTTLVWRWLFSPYVAWPLMAWCTFWWFG